MIYGGTKEPVALNMVEWRSKTHETGSGRCGNALMMMVDDDDKKWDSHKLYQQPIMTSQKMPDSICGGMKSWRLLTPN